MARWVDVGYGVEKLDLGIVTISVYWAMVQKGEPTGYQYSYAGFRSKKLYASMDGAKSAAVESLDTRLASARRVIDDMRKETA